MNGEKIKMSTKELLELLLDTPVERISLAR